MKKGFIGFILVTMSAVVLGGCSAPSKTQSYAGLNILPAQLVNTQEISMDSLENIQVSYLSDNITLLESSSNHVVLKEYMSTDDQQYYASVSQSENNLTITTGERPETQAIDAFQSHIEIYLPVDYHGGLNVETLSGSILSERSLSQSAFQAVSTSGSISVGDIKADTIKIGATSGSIKGGVLTGSIEIETTSGELKVSEISGPGKFISQSGSMHIGCGNEVENITATAQSGSINITVPKSLGFHFSAATNSGNITTPLRNQFDGKNEAITGTVGENARILIDITTTSGNILIK